MLNVNISLPIRLYKSPPAVINLTAVEYEKGAVYLRNDELVRRLMSYLELLKVIRGRRLLLRNHLGVIFGEFHPIVDVSVQANLGVIAWISLGTHVFDHVPYVFHGLNVLHVRDVWACSLGNLHVVYDIIFASTKRKGDTLSILTSSSSFYEFVIIRWLLPAHFMNFIWTFEISSDCSFIWRRFGGTQKATYWFTIRRVIQLFL